MNGSTKTIRLQLRKLLLLVGDFHAITRSPTIEKYFPVREVNEKSRSEEDKGAHYSICCSNERENS